MQLFPQRLEDNGAACFINGEADVHTGKILCADPTTNTNTLVADAQLPPPSARVFRGSGCDAIAVPEIGLERDGEWQTSGRMTTCIQQRDSARHQTCSVSGLKAQ